ncbi:LuxR C-terminal-related transcriptional regulator [Labrys sp. KB_33_2]|uniref:LuxR C-terminal-related transcriptional regulator n=1 Tax=Labrys sp. KB_33_2 TaxID=3237479 RepID=UPI003F926653
MEKIAESLGILPDAEAESQGNLESPLQYVSNNSRAVTQFITSSISSLGELHLVCRSSLLLDCLMIPLKNANVSSGVFGYRSVGEWESSENTKDNAVVILCGLGNENARRTIEFDLPRVCDVSGDAKVIIISDIEDTFQVSRSLELGARGFIGTTSSVDIVLAAIRLISAGGSFIPPQSLRKSLSDIAKPETTLLDSAGLTRRQVEIIGCLRRGDKNKTIAKKLNIEESTVVAHIQNVMRKLKAKNRTEVIYILDNNLLKKR